MGEKSFNSKRIREFIEDTINRHRCEPKFYTISGSHIYGFDAESSDVDIRGIHLADGIRYSMLNKPTEQISVNQGSVSEGYKNYKDLEICSFELRKFGKLIYKMNFNVLEWLYHGKIIINSIDLELESLKRIVESHMPGGLPLAYRGMAKNNYHKYIDSMETARPKKYLYVIRGLLGAKHTLNNKDIEPDVTKLAKMYLDKGGQNIVEDLIEQKRSPERDKASLKLGNAAHQITTRLFNEIELDYDIDKSGFRRDIDDWMQKVRK